MVTMTMMVMMPVMMHDDYENDGDYGENRHNASTFG